MSVSLKRLSDFAEWGFDDIIDVRSPLEFAQDHIPGAVNMPALSDQERAEVGTIYVQESRFEARRIGAAYVARNVADHIEQFMSEKDGSWRPLVYCWRGGQRSNSFGSILAQIGWRVDVLTGGYRTYRREVTANLYETPLTHKLILLAGGTGSAKTEILARLGKRKAQVLDLEALANHRGSLFGNVAGNQPSQKLFEGRIAQHLADLDPNKTTLVEAESNRIGQLKIPPSLWKAMCAAPCITVNAPLDVRAQYLTTAYPDLIHSQVEMEKNIRALGPYQPKEQIEEWTELLKMEDGIALAQALLSRHYDPSYDRSQKRYERAVVGQIDISDLTKHTLEEAVIPEILRLIAHK